jgi:hypothetical protein
MRKSKISLADEEAIVNQYLKEKNVEKLRSKYKTSFKDIKNILIKNNIYSGRRSTSLNLKYFENIDSNEKAYWLGFISADGSLSKNGYKLSFGVKDSDILEKFKRAISSGSPVSDFNVYDERTDKTYNRYSLQICSKEFCQYIRNHGVDENKSKVFKFPKIDEKYYSHFIRGLYDGDGSICIVKSKVIENINFRANIISSLECVNYIKVYLESINISSNKIFSKHDQNIHYITFGKDVIKFLNWIYKDSSEETRLDRKYNKFIDNLHDYNTQHKIFQIKNHQTGVTHKVKNLIKFCKDNNLNDNYLRYNMTNGKIPTKGKHLGWELLPN